MDILPEKTSFFWGFFAHSAKFPILGEEMTHFNTQPGQEKLKKKKKVLKRQHY